MYLFIYLFIFSPHSLQNGSTAWTFSILQGSPTRRRHVIVRKNPADGSFDGSLVFRKAKGRLVKRKGIVSPRMEHLTSAPPDLAAALEILSPLWNFSRGKRKMSLDVGEFLKTLKPTSVSYLYNYILF